MKNANQIIDAITNCSMSHSEKTENALKHAKKSQREIYADAGFSTYQYFNFKVVNQKLELKEMEAIAHAIGARLSVSYVFDDGTII